MRQISTLSVLIVLLSCLGCDKENAIDYIVDNRTEDTLFITYSYMGHYFVRNPRDSAISVPGNQKVKLFTHVSIGPGVYNPEQEKAMSLIDAMTVLRIRDSILSHKHTSEKANWNFIETDKHKANYEFFVDSSDF